MIKNIIKKLFFADAPAQGALFGMTLWRVAGFVLGGVFITLVLTGVLVITDACLTPIWLCRLLIMTWIVIVLYSSCLILRFYYRIGRTSRWRLGIFGGMIALLVLSTAASVMFAGQTMFLCAVIINLFWLFPALLLPWTRWYYYLAGALARSGALLIGWTFWVNLLEAQEKWDSDVTTQGSIAQWLGLSANGWIALTTFGLLLSLSGYLLIAKMMGDARQIPFRRMFGKGVITLWAVALVAYLTFAALAVAAEHRTAKATAALEQRFGHPMTAKAMSKLYYNNDQPDPVFWRNAEALVEKCDSYLNDRVTFAKTPHIIPAEAMHEWRLKYAAFDGELARLEKIFDGPIPPLERQYQTGRLMKMKLPNLNLLRTLSAVELGRVHFALMDNDIEAALKTYYRMRHFDSSLLRETNLIGGLIWIKCENRRLEALRLLLESGLLSDAQLSALAADLKTTQAQVPIMAERCLYGETVAAMDVFEMIGQGAPVRNSSSQTMPPGKIAGAVWPQIWYYTIFNKADLAERCNVAKFKQFNSPGSGLSRLLCCLYLPRANSQDRFDSFSARLLGAQTIIRAIEYQRRHGEYPQTLDNLPIDPRTGTPLSYYYGDHDLTLNVVTQSPEGWSVELQEMTLYTLTCGNADYTYFFVRIKP